MREWLRCLFESRDKPNDASTLEWCQIRIDCRTLNDDESLHRITMALLRPGSSFQPLAIFLDNLTRADDALARLLKGVTSLLADSGRRALVIDPTGCAAGFLESAGIRCAVLDAARGSVVIEPPARPAAPC